MRLGGTQRHATPRGLLRLPNVDRGRVVVDLQVTRIDIYALALQAWLFVHVAKTDAKLETGVEEFCNPVMETLFQTIMVVQLATCTRAYA